MKTKKILNQNFHEIENTNLRTIGIKDGHISQQKGSLLPSKKLYKKTFLTPNIKKYMPINTTGSYIKLLDKNKKIVTS